MNNKLTTPIAILIGSFMIAGTILYTNGFNFSIIPEVKADVGGMDYRDLRRDRDFKKAVRYIVEDYDYTTRSDVESIVDDCSISLDVAYESADISC